MQDKIIEVFAGAVPLEAATHYSIELHPCGEGATLHTFRSDRERDAWVAGYSEAGRWGVASCMPTLVSDTRIIGDRVLAAFVLELVDRYPAPARINLMCEENTWIVCA